MSQSTRHWILHKVQELHNAPELPFRDLLEPSAVAHVLEENQVRFHPQFDVIILLSAPAEILAERLASRTGNPYGKTPAELRWVFDDLQTVEPLLRKAADHEIHTTVPLSDVVTAVLRLTGE